MLNYVLKKRFLPIFFKNYLLQVVGDKTSTREPKEQRKINKTDLHSEKLLERWNKYTTNS